MQSELLLGLIRYQYNYHAQLLKILPDLAMSWHTKVWDQ